MQVSSTLPVTRRDYHVVPNGGLWAVRQEGAKYAELVVFTKTEAMAHAITQARAGYVSLVEHGRDGEIQSVRSYDNWVDPFD